jgi:shikimate kinase
MNEDEEIKENFCGACAVIPVALVGGGVITASQNSNYKKNKKIILYIGISITVISLLVSVYFLLKCKSCR